MSNKTQLTLKNKTMERSISVYDFHFVPSGYGHYKVTFRSRNTGREWTTTTADMPLIDATRNAAYPKIKDLTYLRRLCKRGGYNR